MIFKIIKMKSFLLLMIFILINRGITINAKNSTLGKAPCMYSGDFDEYGYYCADKPMPINEIPTWCTSLIYDGVNFNSNALFNYTENDEFNINALVSSGKPLYLYYGYTTQIAWIEAISTSNGSVALEKISKFLTPFNVSGLILKNLNYDYNSNLNFHFDTSFYTSLKEYVILLKKKVPNLSIGLYVSASHMIFYSDNSMSEDWFDFTVLNDVMDYYIIGFHNFNPCNEFFKCGTVPLNNVLNSTHSLTTFAEALNCSTIAKDKIYLEFSVTPTVNDTTTEYLPTCAVTYKKFCEADNYNIFWCADSADSLYQKGWFAKNINAQGIVAKYIDTIDPTAQCDCDSKNKFMTFSIMIRGFTGIHSINDCVKLNDDEWIIAGKTCYCP